MKMVLALVDLQQWNSEARKFADYGWQNAQQN